mmetsp:Transcript_23073/g.39229  ORF Transcript_23073/g.39229 Transcript_23073/m.39229 type:complete len:167 (+) Transcript_23073:79-579(+)
MVNHLDIAHKVEIASLALVGAALAFEPSFAGKFTHALPSGWPTHIAGFLALTCALALYDLLTPTSGPHGKKNAVRAGIFLAGLTSFYLLRSYLHGNEAVLNLLAVSVIKFVYYTFAVYGDHLSLPSVPSLSSDAEPTTPKKSPRRSRSKSPARSSSRARSPARRRS